MNYEHNIEMQHDALDKGLEAYQESKEKEIEELETYLEETEQVVKDSLDLVKNHTDDIFSTLTQLGAEYGITLSSQITTPWQSGEDAMDEYAKKLEAIQKKMNLYVSNANNLAASEVAEADQLISPKPAESEGSSTTPSQQPNNPPQQPNNPPQQPNNPPNNPSPPSSPPKVGSKVKIDSSAKYYGGQSTNVLIPKELKNKSYTVQQLGYNNKQVLLKELYSWVKISDLVGYAKGTTGVKRDQFAIVDEGGFEELIMHAGKNGRVEYLTKGSSVIPHDITKNLMKLGQLDPTEVLRRSMPTMGAIPMVTNNNMEINLDIAEVVHIEHADSNSITAIENAVEAKLNSYMKTVNQSMKKFIREEAGVVKHGPFLFCKGWCKCLYFIAKFISKGKQILIWDLKLWNLILL